MIYLTSLTEIKENVLNFLKSSTMLTDTEIVGEFEGKNKPAIDKPLLVLGIDSVELEPAGLGGYFGENHDGVHQGAWANITLRFDCYLGLTKENYDVQCVFEKLCQALITSDLGINKIYSSPISSSKGTFEAKLTAKAELGAIISSSAPKHIVSDFILKRSDLNK